MDTKTGEFLSKGLSIYLELLRTLHNFQKHIQDRARDALRSRQKELSDALGSPLIATIEDYESHDDTKAWVAVQAQCPAPLGSLYLGVLWELRDDGTPAQIAVATLDAGAAQRRAKLLRCATEMTLASGFTVVHGGWNEVQMRTDLGPEEMPLLESKLGAILDEWSRFFQKVGGLRSL
jgi:hypothetical protein